MLTLRNEDKPTGGDVTNTGEPPIQPQGENPIALGGGTRGASTSHRARNEDGAETSDRDDELDDARSTHPGREREFHSIPYGYSRLIFNDSSRSLHVGKIPQFDGVGYSKWKNLMEEYLIVVNPTLWIIVNRGGTFPSGDATLTQEQRNYQALHIIKISLSPEEYDKVRKGSLGNTLHQFEGSKQVRVGRIRALEGELSRFIIKEDESPQDMCNHLNKIVNKIKSLGSTRWGRREVVDKIISAYMQ
jgi:hypothetical protein